MKKKQVIALIVAAALLCAVFILYIARGAIYNGLNDLKLIPQPERFTELYFENASTLPKHTVAKQVITFSFTIHNLEGVTTTYPYTVYLKYPFANQETLTTNQVVLADKATTTIAVTHTFPATNEQVEVVVDLTTLGQSIDFLMPNNN